MPVIWSSGAGALCWSAAGVVATIIFACSSCRLLRNVDVSESDLADQLQPCSLHRGREVVVRVEGNSLATVAEPDHIGGPAIGLATDGREHLLEDRDPVVNLRGDN